MEEQLVIECPKMLVSNDKAYTFLLTAHKKAVRTEKKEIIWDMRRTKVFETNLLAIYSFAFEELFHKNKSVYVWLPDGKRILCNASVMKIFQHYAVDKRAFYKPRKVGIFSIRETEDLLLKFLKDLRLRQYDTVKTLLSEIIANIKMHTIYHEGIIAGCFSERRNCIVVSIGNYDYSIPKQLECKSKMVFDNDMDAVIWSLKKSNSTRNSEETGGLGLYLLRKYIAQLDGVASIMSGNCYIELDSTGYDPENENKVDVKMAKTLEEAYQGTVITLFIPYEIEVGVETESPKSIGDYINLLDI